LPSLIATISFFEGGCATQNGRARVEFAGSNNRLMQRLE